MTMILSQWLDYFESSLGFILPTTQHRWLENAVQMTADSHNLSMMELWENIKVDKKLRQELFDAVLILESRFFRHMPSFEYIQSIASAWKQHKIDQKKKNTLNNTFRVWSVGCSEGQEAWSVAMALAHMDLKSYHVLGTDISTKAIRSARSAIYDNRSIYDIPNEYHHFFHEYLRTSKKNKTQLIVDKSLRRNVSFILNNIFLSDNHSLNSAHLMFSNDVIICQNMLIYFRQFDQRDILARLVDRCKIGGYIILAPGEAFFWKHPKMEKVASNQVNAWKRIC